VYFFKGIEREYYPDLYIVPENRIVEVKSDYSLRLDYEKNIAKTDSYVEFWLRDLSKYFSIIFLDVLSSPFISKRASYFTKDRCYTSFDLIYSDMFAAFCFGRGSMCNRDNSMRLLEKGILRIAVIYDNFIFNEMKKAISNGLFDIVLLSSFSKG
jgi:hypothetical protein